MNKNSDLNELREIYSEMDEEGKEKMVAAAAELLGVQTNLSGTLNTAKATPRRLVSGYLLSGLFLLFIAYIFWITLINPALLMIDTTPLTMIWIIVTAICGIFFIGVGLVSFILRKLSVPWVIFAIGAGILCLDPRAFTDFIGIIFAVLIITTQIIHGKQGKTATVYKVGF